ncbi:golgin-45 isoform X2 [Malaya genurostris]|uniref:golgin-45 isoform X2 n=1 Tax=Malaya genurostris TaxID=325434 RepID=UPI0026F3FC88|nr:golgin-45 isoform X2 [Malaya genurostris]
MDSARTRGDGMENEVLATPGVVQPPRKISNTSLTGVNELKLPIDFDLQRLLPHSGSNLIYRPTELVTTASASLTPTVPRGTIFALIPKLVPTNKAGHSLKGKEPRFVPFEPYKDLNVLVSQMSTITNKELKGNSTANKESNCFKQEYEKQIEELRKERDYYQSQLKFQAQVNSELKNLLVAAVGEDLQTKVNVLTEDKLHLARKLLNSAENLSSHTEQIEFLAGQSEVWRSKFLASSLMVEELARWKTSLLQKNALLLSSNKELLEVTSKLREMQIDMLKNLNFLSNQKEISLKSSSALDLTAECLNISQQLVLGHAALGMPEPLDLSQLDPMCSAEKLAVQALQHSNEPLMSTDEAFRAIVGQAFPSINLMKQHMEQSTSDFELVEKPSDNSGV